MEEKKLTFTTSVQEYEDVKEQMAAILEHLNSLQEATKMTHKLFFTLESETMTEQERNNALVALLSWGNYASIGCKQLDNEISQIFSQILAYTDRGINL